MRCGGAALRGAPHVHGRVKASAGWRAKGMINEAEFVRGMELSVSEGIMRAGIWRGPLRRLWAVSGAGRGIRTPVSRGTWD